jgi:hypothetical protein
MRIYKYCKNIVTKKFLWWSWQTKCGTELPIAAKVCPCCGATVPEKPAPPPPVFCPKPPLKRIEVTFNIVDKTNAQKS